MLKKSNFRGDHNSEDRWQPRWKFPWGLSGATDLSAYDPLLALAVASTRGDNAFRAEVGFSRHLNFRLFQQYRRRAAVPDLAIAASSVRRLRLRSGSGLSCLASNFSSCVAAAYGRPKLASSSETEQFGRSGMPRWSVDNGRCRGEMNPARRCRSAFRRPSEDAVAAEGRVHRTVARAGAGDHLRGTFAWLNPNLISCSTDAHGTVMADRRHVAVVVMGWLFGAPPSR
jgi:hypothetical protein